MVYKVMAERYILNWQTFSEHLQSMLKELYEEGRYSDVTLVSDDQIQFKAHKIVLSACSPVFRKIIDSNPSQHPLIYLRGIHSHEMQSILQFMYLGEGKLFQERMEEMIKVAQNLEVKEISDNLEMQSEMDTTKVNTENNTEDTVADEFGYDNEEPLQVENVGRKRKPNAKPTQCPECGVMYSSSHAMWIHYYSTHQAVNYPCNHCDYKALTKVNLQIHIKSKHEGVKYQCNYCDFEASRKGNLQTHIKIQHKNISNLIVKEEEMMKKHFTEQQRSAPKDLEMGEIIDGQGGGIIEDNSIRYKPMKEVKKKVLETESKSSQCPECEAEYSYRGDMLKHYRSIHEGIKYPCNQCDYQAPQKKCLRRHMESKHEGIKYPCNQCDYQAPQRKTLNRHIQSVHEHVRYPCNLCDFQSARKNILNKHMITKHSTEMAR